MKDLEDWIRSQRPVLEDAISDARNPELGDPMSDAQLAGFLVEQLLVSLRISREEA